VINGHKVQVTCLHLGRLQRAAPEIRCRLRLLQSSAPVCAVDERVVTLPALVGNAGEVRVALLCILAHDQAVIERVGRQEVVGVVLRVDDDLAECVVHMWILQSQQNQKQSGP
jgi:hypothetical protein